MAKKQPEKVTDSSGDILVAHRQLFANRLIDYYKDKGWTRTELSGFLGFDKGSTSSYLNHPNSMPLKFMLTTCQKIPELVPFFLKYRRLEENVWFPFLDDGKPITEARRQILIKETAEEMTGLMKKIHGLMEELDLT